jgi:hypothetical protein
VCVMEYLLSVSARPGERNPRQTGASFSAALSSGCSMRVTVFAKKNEGYCFLMWLVYLPLYLSISCRPLSGSFLATEVNLVSLPSIFIFGYSISTVTVL